MTYEQLAKRIEDEETRFTITFTATPTLDETIEIRDSRDRFVREILDTKDQAVKEALASLGWTPPNPTQQQLAALAEKQGFALVPLEPTIEMETAAKDRNEDEAYGIHGTIYGGIYAAMVEAGRVKP